MKFMKKITLVLISIYLFGCHAKPEDLIFEKNYLKGLELSAKTNKPIFIHFTCFGCFGYNEFEYDLITSKEIQETLNEEFITIQLYVDDKRPIDTNDTLNFNLLGFSEEGQKKINKATNKGHLNATIQIEKYNMNAQPWYVIIDKNERALIEPFGYTSRNKDYFLSQLKSGVEEFKNKNVNE